MALAAPAPEPRPGDRFIFNRPPRVQPTLPDREFVIASPPALSSRPQPINPITIVAPVLLMAVSGMMFFQFGGDRTLLLIALGATVIVSTVGSLGGILWDRRLQRRDDAAQLAAYARLLDEQEQALARLHEEQRRIRQDNDPDLPSVVARARRREDRLWERRPTDADFLCLRLGVGELPSSVTIVTPPADQFGPHLRRARQLAETYAIVRDVPVTVDLPAIGSVGIAGPADTAARLLQAMLIHLATHQAPDEVRLAAIVPEPLASEWSWLAQLPHTRPLQSDSRAGLVATTPAAAEQVMSALLDELSRREQLQPPIVGEATADRPRPPHVVVLIIGRDPLIEHVAVDYLIRRGKTVGASVIYLVDSRGDIPGEAGAIIEIAGSAQANYAVAGPGGWTVSCIPDTAGPEECRAVADALQGGRLRGRQGTDDLPSDVRLLSLLGIDLTTHQPDAAWRRPAFGPFAAPLGVQLGGAPLVLELSEHGPHGLIAGTTGSGKSELLQTLIVGFALTHDPRQLTFVLIDYKGGGSLNVFRHLPHTVGLITNLQGRLAERALTAFDAELKRRQRLFAEADVQNLAEYRRRRPEAMLPNLVIVIDEFAELARELPDFMVRLISIAQTGRTLGLHLLLATQRPSGVVNANIWANTRFRICLRVESLEDSREVLARPDAALLPHNRPGRGYFQVGQDIFRLFQTARVAALYEGALPAALDATDERDALPADPSDAQVIVALLARYARAHGLDRLPGPWSEPLAPRVTLPAVLEQLGWPEAVALSQAENWAWPAPTQERWLQAPIGLLDDIAVQQHRPLVLDFQREGTHLMVAGSAGSGKSTLLRTLLTALALTHDPTSLWCYLIDFGGQALAPLHSLPHVGGFFRPNESARIRRLLRRLAAELERRKTMLGEAHAVNVWHYRQLTGAPLPVWMVVIDNFAGFRESFEDDLPTLATIAREGRAVGLHLALTIDRPSALHSSLASNIELRLALRLTDPLESGAVIDKSDAAQLDSSLPGRGLLPGRQLTEFQTALPLEAPDEDAQVAALQALAERLRHAWADGPRPEPIELLPNHVPLVGLLRTPGAAVINGDQGRWPAPLALDDQHLRPVAVDLEQDGPHMLVTGNAGSGKSVALRAWALALAERAAPDDLQLALIGLRRSLRPLRRLPHVIDGGYVENASQLGELTARLQAEFERRQALLQEFYALDDQPAGTPAPWPTLVIVVDDCETVLSAAGMEAERLADIARGSRDVGIHLLVAGGVEEMKTSYQPLVQQLRAGRTGLLLRVGDPADGLVLGVRLPYNLEAADYPPGRGHLVTTAGARLVQFATGDGAEHDATALAGWVDRIVARYASVPARMRGR